MAYIKLQISNGHHKIKFLKMYKFIKYDRKTVIIGLDLIVKMVRGKGKEDD